MMINANTVISTLTIAIILLVFGMIQECKAQEVNETALALAQCIVSECNHCDNNKSMKEPIATAWVIYKRMIAYNNNKYNKRKRTFKEQIHAYCAIFDKGARKNYNGPKQIKRRKEILASTFNDPIYLDTKVDKEWWIELKRFSLAFIINPYIYEDPCPNSFHFGGDMDVKHMQILGWVKDEQCSDMNNNFFRKVKK